ncbi:hypothetical protein J1605_005680 [Eschrichtius robustus]|uniref:Uncharacterized protein n=1 Tax=Eschrichtius robustus TaxID=9764 RepID=A0AB34H7B1_ESCRO|nr:hypothetical protein J1605_005680 [Eschrichtius robustus]
MGSPALRPALLPLLPLLPLLLRVPPSRGFPGRVGGPASPAGRQDPRLGPEGGAGAPFVCADFVFRRPGERGTRSGARVRAPGGESRLSSRRRAP